MRRPRTLLMSIAPLALALLVGCEGASTPPPTPEPAAPVVDAPKTAKGRQPKPATPPLGPTGIVD